MLRSIAAACLLLNPVAISTATFPKWEWISQPLDHFDPSNNLTLRQRYFVNNTWFDGTGPIFLCVGGEGGRMKPSVVSSTGDVHCADMVELAADAKALLVALEHRYFGLSLPPPENERSMAFLSSPQAVEDLAAFHGHLTKEFGLGNDLSNPWVAWGGSYPGMLAAYFRLKKPELVAAAVASSAPLGVTVDFGSYKDLVGRALSLGAVGGSDECRRVVEDGHASLVSQLATGEEAQRSVAAQFGFCDGDALLDEGTRHNWAGQGVIFVPAQGNDPNCTPSPFVPTGDLCDIGRLCTYLLGDGATAAHASFIHDDDSSKKIGGTGSTDIDVARLAATAALQRHGKCLDVSGMSTEALNASYKALGESGSVSDQGWPWLTCTQFGFIQTCELGSSCPFAKGYLNLSTGLDICELAFGISEGELRENVAAFAAWSEGLDNLAEMNATRIFFANGDVDPWSALGVLSSPDSNATLPTYQVYGASHHFWTHPAADITQSTVSDAKKAIQAWVMDQLGLP